MVKMRLLRLALVILGLAAVATAQSFTGTLTGTVSDPSGAIVPGVTITLSNPSSGYQRTAKTDEYGNYTFLSVPPGTYAVAAEKAGFNRQMASNVVITVAQQARLNLALRVGSVKEEVTVSGTSTNVQTDSATVGGVMGGKAIENLPLNGRDYTQLAALTPGVSYNGTNNWGHFVSMNGGRNEKTEFLIDGMSNTETWSGGALLSPSVDDIQEFRVQSNLANAEYGRGIGYINATTKSGTNQFHGRLFEFHRGSGLDARNYFATTRPYLKREQYGGSLGGPIIKNKLFFYGDYEKTDLQQDVTTNVRVPTNDVRGGNFSGTGVTVIDPTTGLPFPGDIIPPNRISSIASYFLPYMPGPNSGLDRFIINTPQPTHQRQISGRIDKQSGSTNVTGHYMFGDSNQYNAFGGQIYGPTNPLGNTVMSVLTHNVSLDVTHTFTPNLLLDARAGYYFNRLYEWTPSDGTVNRTIDSGIGGFDQTSAGLTGFPYLYVGDYGGIPGGLNLDITTKQEVYSYQTSLSWTHGKHLFKAGFEMFREKGTSHHYFISKGFFAFDGAYTGDAFADYLLGYPNYSDRSFPQALWGSINNRYHFYAQDDWRVTPNLTLNLGLRVEFNPYPSPLRGGSNFDPALGKVILASRNGQIDFFQPESQLYYQWNPSWYTTSEAAGVPFSLVRTTGSHLNPRIGFAWRPFGGTKTVIRGGYGIYTLPLMGQISRGASVVNPPWTVFEFKYAPTPTDWATFWPDISSSSGFLPTMVTAVQPNFHTPYAQQWNLTVERELPWDSTFSLGYVGNSDIHLQTNVNINQPPYGPNSWSEIPFPQFGAFSQGFNSNGTSSYHSLQAKFDKHFSNGLLIGAAYTWSRAIDYTSTDLNFIRDRFNMRAERGPSDLNVPQRLALDWYYELPVGPGKRFLNAKGWVGKVVGGWATAGIAQFQSGLPFSVMSPIDTSGFFVNGGQYADRVAGCNPNLGNPTPAAWFNTACFTQAAQYTIGNSGRNSLRAAGINEFDLSLVKNTYITESKYIQLRVEAFNAFNHPMFNAPYATIGLATSGQVTSAKPARELQLGVKIFF